ncbi:MAG: hypothetical protein ACP5FK_00230 [bacterium]
MLPSEPKLSIFAGVFWGLVLLLIGIVLGRFVLARKPPPPIPADTLNTLQLRILSLEDSVDCVNWHLQDVQKKLIKLESLYSDSI